MSMDKGTGIQRRGAGPAGLLVFFTLFTVSGFSGLIYESVWSQYLKLFLGHAAYAQAVVLAIFMGGMSIGAWLCAGLIHRVANPLRAYAVVEGTIGIIALLFDSIYRMVTTWVLESVFADLESAALAQGIKWGVAALLILPQSVLLGATFPLMSNGLLRWHPADTGRVLGTLYFTNSIGGAAGVLTSGFLLIALVGLPGTMLSAGLMNILLAIAVYGLSKSADRPAPVGAARPSAAATGRLPRFILLAALITGLSSFVYEIVWIRMLSMVLGSSTHAFELMLSAFITGLALGGFIVRKRMSSGRGSLLRAGHIQVLMGLAAFATIPLYNTSFEAMSYVMSGLSRTDHGYVFYNLASHGFALAAMLPATVLAGMTLPLFTAILLERGYGERSVGHVYSFNTLGAIAGTVLTLFALLPLLGIEGALLVAALLDVGLGLAFFALIARERGTPEQLHLGMGSAAAAALLITAFVSSPDPRHMASGVFRTGNASVNQTAHIIAHYDGPTTSVSVLGYSDDTVSILTNGKPDASAYVNTGDEHRMDEPTMLLAAALPLSMRPDATRVAAIGFGSGMSTHMLLTVPTVKQVDTIEIERAMVQGARNFGMRSELAFTDPRSRIVIEDAKTFFYQNGQKYDIIVSEPSNPWVSGISSLFTTEFYTMIRRFLEDDGLLVQWIHAYETDEVLLFSVLKALAANFSDFHVYGSNNSDLLVIAGMQDRLPLPGGEIFQHERAARELARVDVKSVEDLHARFLADRAMLEPLLNFSRAPVNSDFFPFVDQRAAKMLFLRENVRGLHEIRYSFPPLLQHYRPDVVADGVLPIRSDSWNASVFAADALRMADDRELKGAISERLTELLPPLDLVRSFAQGCSEHVAGITWEYSMLEVMIATVPFLDPPRMQSLYHALAPDCPERLGEAGIRLRQVFEGYAMRDFRLIAEGASVLLANRTRYTSYQQRFLFGSLMLALAATGEHAQALTIWRDLGRKIIPEEDDVSFNLRLLHAQLVVQAGEDAAARAARTGVAPAPLGH